jgi:hypothetical protein
MVVVGGDDVVLDQLAGAHAAPPALSSIQARTPTLAGAHAAVNREGCALKAHPFHRHRDGAARHGTGQREQSFQHPFQLFGVVRLGLNVIPSGCSGFMGANDAGPLGASLSAGSPSGSGRVLVGGVFMLAHPVA